MFRAASFAFIWLSISNPAAAQAILWRNVQSGDTPQQVEAKLRGMAEVKSVKTKIRGETVREQDINMIEGGVPIFDGHFSIATMYKGLSLERLQLASGFGCANTTYDFAAKISEELAGKYPTAIVPLQDEYAFSRVALDATSTTPTSISSALSNGTAVALLTIVFQYEDPPTYLSGALGRALYQIARAGYDSRANSYGGTGYRTGSVRITYISQAVWDEGYAASQSDAEEAKKAARDNL